MPGADHLRLVHEAGGPAAPPEAKKPCLTVESALRACSPDSPDQHIVWLVVEVIEPGAAVRGYPIDRLGVIEGFVRRLGFWSVLDAAGKAVARIEDTDKRFHYWRGICRNKLAEFGGRP